MYKSNYSKLAKSPKKLITSILFNNLPNCYCILPNRQLPLKVNRNFQSQLGTPKVSWKLPQLAENSQSQLQNSQSLLGKLPKFTQKLPKLTRKYSNLVENSQSRLENSQSRLKNS